MSEITTSEVVELNDPKLLKIATRIVREAELSADKVAANFKQPAKFPLSNDPETFENLLKARFSALPESAKETAAQTAAGRLNASVAVRKNLFGDLAGVDLSSNKSVDEQVKAIALPAALKFSSIEATALTSVIAAAAPAAGGIKKLELRIHKVKCVDETGSWWQEIGNDDEIDLAGTSVDGLGNAKAVNPFRVGSSFDDGESKLYSPPRSFTVFNVLEGSTFPKQYIVTLVLSEADGGGFNGFINKLFQLVKDKVTAAIIAAGLPLGPAIAALIANVVSYVIDRLISKFISWWKDDVFAPKTLTIRIPSLTATWNGSTDSPERVIEFRGHNGHYQLTYDWRLFA